MPRLPRGGVVAGLHLLEHSATSLRRDRGWRKKKIEVFDREIGRDRESSIAYCVTVLAVFFCQVGRVLPEHIALWA